MSAIGHIRVGLVRASRRSMGSPGNPGRTLCGKPLTWNDGTLSTYKRHPQGNPPHVLWCQDCVNQARAMRAAAGTA